MRKEIKEFAEAMEDTMFRHDNKKGDSWKDLDIDDLRKILHREYHEWDFSIDDETEGYELIDIANLCMMLWNRLNECKGD